MMVATDSADVNVEVMVYVLAVVLHSVHATIRIVIAFFEVREKQPVGQAGHHGAGQ